MIIHDVKLVHKEEVKPGAMQDGLPLAPQPETFAFDVVYEGLPDEERIQHIVPNDPTNSQYWLVKEWYDAQKTKPFDFKFEEVGEPNFAETIYPEPEETEEPAEPEEVPEDEPKTLLPK